MYNLAVNKAYNPASAKNALNGFLEYKKHYKTRISGTYLSLRNRLVEEHSALVVGIAKHFSRNGVLGDLIQEGQIGLIKALDYYNKKKGAFSTYATYWIRHKILEFIKKDSMVRKPIDVMVYCCRLLKDPEYSGNPNAMGNKGIIKSARIKSKGDLERIKNGLETFVVQSLDAPINEEEGVLSDIVGKEDTLPDNVNLIGYEKKYFSRLDERERMIIKMRYAPQSERTERSNISKNILGCTLKEIGEIMGISRERARQIESRALRKMRFMKEEENKKPELMIKLK